MDLEEGELPPQQVGAMGPGAAPHPNPHIPQLVVVPPPLAWVPPSALLHIRYQYIQLRLEQMSATMLELWQHFQASTRPNSDTLDRIKILRTTRPTFSREPDQAIWEGDELKPRSAFQQDVLVSSPAS